MYLALHKWLSGHSFPIEDGLVLSRFAYLQIKRTFEVMTRRVLAMQPMPSADYKALVDSVKVDYIDGRPHLGEELRVASNAVYLNVIPNFELFYAPAPFEDIEWRLLKEARKGSIEAQKQLEQLKQGIIEEKGKFQRDYAAYDDFAACLKDNIEHSKSEAGFFSLYVGPKGVSRFDEKEVDTRIVMRAMDAFHNKEVDSICIVSSDQDFMPLHDRAADVGIVSFQAELAKFLEGDNVGRKLKDLGDRFVQGGIDPTWPLEILLEAVSKPGVDHFERYHLSEAELRGLCELNNEMNDINIEIDLKADGDATFKMTRPA